MKILLVTSSARGHALADALHRSNPSPEIISVSSTRNPGIRKLAAEQHVLDLADIPAILEVAKSTRPDFAVIGPEDPLALGLADNLEGIGIPTVGPKKSLARIESSKGFTRDLMHRHGIDASPKYRVFTEANDKEIQRYIEDELQGEYVVKYDALKGGKGVKVSGEHLDSIDEGVQYAVSCVQECGRVVLEEKLIGVEFSLISFTSGTQVVDTPAVQDHKRAYNGDTGSNTGGMGTYSDADHSLPFLQKGDLERASEINRLVASALREECGEPYKGFLYGGFIAVKGGVRVIEYNCRFGDPEALNILAILSSDFVNICEGIIGESLTPDLVKFEKKATVCKYIVPEGYPENKDQKGAKVTFPAMPENARLYFGDIGEDEDGTLRLGGSRGAGIVGIGSTIAEAEKVAQALCEKVEGPVRFRSDIGTADLLNHRITTMRQIRG
jgi:phosphoribosylamine--glycine ligase